MKINDTVYGTHQINEPVLVELINSQPLKRIKGVNQYGSQLVFPNKKVTRYQHCVGTMLLLRIKGAGLEEQIAGLLHDVPHTAFSHAVDFVFGQGHKGTYHEQFLKKIVFESKIPSILKKYGIDVHRITDEENFSLLERPLPRLCADRLDYTLRELIELKAVSIKTIEDYLKNIIVVDGEFVIANRKVALDFAKKYMYLSESSWISAKTLAAFELLARAIKVALDNKIMTQSDLFKTDREALAILKKSKNKQIAHLLSLLKPTLKVSENKINYDFFVRGKPRFIDPPVIVEGKPVALSSLDKTYKEHMLDFKQRMERGRYLKVKRYK